MSVNKSELEKALMNRSSVVRHRSIFLEWLKIYQLQKFSGQLEIACDACHWRMYLQTGELFWCEDASIWKSRCLCLLTKHCGNALDLDCFEYGDLGRWVEREKVSVKQAAAIVGDCCREAIFDILQQETSSELFLVSNKYEVSIHPLLSTILPTGCEDEALKDWEEWQQDGLEEISPNAIPIWLPATGRWHLREETYCLLKASVNGQNTLRKIAHNLNWDLHYCAKYFCGLAKVGVVAWRKAPSKLATLEVERSTDKNIGNCESSCFTPLFNRSTQFRVQRKAFLSFGWLVSTCNRFVRPDISTFLSVNSMPEGKKFSLPFYFQASQFNWKVVAIAIMLAILAPLGLTQSSRLQRQPSSTDLQKSRETQKIKILADTWSGYSTVQNADFQLLLKKQGVEIAYEHEFNQVERARRLDAGEVSN
ncbi:hypothetical protein B7486_39725 [cyanobacterium TDX16]|nr:hypothetical protein B7486_39725 [cyanobacterium TDX16]